MFFYKVYGLNIHSNLQLPELIPYKGEADVLIDFGEVKFSETNSFINGTKYKLTPEEIYLSWSDVANFKVHMGREITISPVPDVDEDVLREVIMGPVLAILLYQRGNLVLHASAVNINGNAAAFLGWAGSGKSTTSMAMYIHGHSLIADDILPVNVDSTHIFAYPGFPAVKLESDDITAEKYNLEIMKKGPNLEKNLYYLKEGFSTVSAPLKRIYVLEKGTKIGINELNPQDALIELLHHSYCSQLFQSNEKSTNLIQCSDLIKNVNVKVLKLGKSLEELPEVVKLVEADILEDK